MLILNPEQLLEKTRSSLQAAREAYSTAISQRSSSQREVNELLQRKHAWTPNDLERFTTLYRSDHANEQTETAAQDNLAATERRAEEAATKLSASILARYHEEQIWSDKIRRMSTWGTWGLMGVNVLLFLVFQIGVEPWRRKRLVKGFEEKVMEALEREGATSGPETTLPQNSNRATAEVSAPAKEATSTSTSTSGEPEPEIALLEIEQPPPENTIIALEHVEENKNTVSGTTISMSVLESIQESLMDIFSRRQVVVSRVDLTFIALEGVAAGSIIATALLMLLKSYR